MIKKILFLLVAMISSGLLAFTLTPSRCVYPDANEEYAILLVAAKDLPIATKLEKEKLPELIMKKKVRKSDIPLDALQEDELIGKTVTKNLKADESFLISNVGSSIGCCVSNGKQLYVIKLPYEAVGPWVQHGKKVDVVCTHRQPGSSVVRHMKLTDDMLVLAVDVPDKPMRTMGCGPLIYTVTLEASLEQAHWLQLAQDAGAHLRLLVRVDNHGGILRLPDDELFELLKGNAKENQNRQDGKK